MERVKALAIIKAILSGLVWGLGQLFNKQFVKALMFFSIFLILIFVEISSGSYGSEFDLYEDKLPGEEIGEEISNYYVEYYYYNLDLITSTFGSQYTDFDLLHYAAEMNDMTFDETTLEFKKNENGVTVDVSNVELTPEQLYTFLGTELQDVEDSATAGGLEQIAIDADLMAIDDIVGYAEGSIREDAIRDVRAAPDYATETLPNQIEVLAIEDLVADSHVIDEPLWEITLGNYIDSNYESLLVEAENILFDAKYDEIYTDIYDLEYQSQYLINYITRYNIYYNQLYGEFVVEVESIHAFQTLLQDYLDNGQLSLDNDDANRMLLKIYYEYNTEEFNALTSKIDNHWYERGGFFTKGVWGVTTLGSVPLTTVTDHKILGFLLPSNLDTTLEYRELQIEGHHSTRLLLEGIIAFMVLFYMSIIYVWNVIDAYKTSITRASEEVHMSERKYFEKLYEDFFEYIVLTPALLLVTFISVMPIFFGLAVAFTNYNIEHIPPGQLVSWVGMENFFQVFSLTSGSSIDFGGQFWKVFSWTLIWAVGATFTCFFGGFVQAVIISNKRVVFRKAWRSVLILPWAVPALISQMIFRVMFQDVGYVNQVLAKVGVTQWFTEMGFIGKTYTEAINAGPIEQFFHMGTETFQWLSNEANPWFVRIFIIILNIWLGFPFFMALMSGVMTSIDKSLYEAASIDGATGFQQFKFITMPLVLFATSPLLVMTFSGNFNNFGVIYFITGGGPGGGTYETAFAGSTDILISWIYTLTTDANVRWYNMASVFSILIFLIIGSVSAWNFTRTRAFREGD